MNNNMKINSIPFFCFFACLNKTLKIYDEDAWINALTLFETIFF